MVVDESPTSPNAKERTFAMLTSLAPTLTQAGVPLPPAILEYSPLPSALVEKWKEHIKNQPNIPPQVQQMVQQLQQQVQAQQAEIGKLAADKLKLETSQQVELYKVREQAQVDRDVASMKASAEMDKRSVEVYKANLDAAMERLGLIADNVGRQMQASMQSVVPQADRAVQQSVSESIVPGLQQIMQVSQQQIEQLSALPAALDALGTRMAQAVADAVSGSRVLEATKVLDPSTGRVTALRRRFANGEEDELPIRPGSMTLQ
jgi:hypothetical protein